MAIIADSTMGFLSHVLVKTIGTNDNKEEIGLPLHG
jgi:hypothetical protein